MSLVPRETLQVAGHTVALTYDDSAREYAALRESCGVVRRDERPRWVFAGNNAAETLSGLLTNDIEALVPGSGCYAAALTAKGRIVADVRVLRTDEGCTVDVGSRAAVGWAELMRKYVNTRLTKLTDVTAVTGCVGAYGPRAATTVARLTNLDPAELAAMASYHHVENVVFGRKVLIVRSPDLGVPGFDIISSAADAEITFDALVAAGARAVGLSAADTARVEAGRPEWGIDMDDTTLAQEANLDALHAISYTKGCYTGQEVVARVHFRGHVNRTLRGLSGGEPIPPRATLLWTDRSEIGDVRSSVLSPRYGPIALAMVREGIADGEEIFVAMGEHEHAVRVVGLPF